MIFLRHSITSIIFILLISSCTIKNEENGDLIREILAFKEHNNNKLKIDISQIITKHIKTGKTDKALEILEKNGFTYNKIEPKNLSDPQIFIAEKDMRKWSDFGFGNVIKISIKTKNNKIINISGSVIYMHL